LIPKVTYDVTMKGIKALKEYFYPIFSIRYIDFIRSNILFYMLNLF